MKVFHIKKCHLILVLTFGLLFASVIAASEIHVPQPLAGKIIIVDAGHGGVDSGANRPGIREKDINLAITLQLKEALNQYGAKVILSRDSDIELSKLCDNPLVKGRYHRDLAARLEFVEESDADLYISIHANTSTDGRRRGPESFYYAKSPYSKALANTIQTSLAQLTHAQATANPGDYFVLRRNKVPAALIEVGYLSNTAERTLLQSASYQQQLAQAIAQGICIFYGLGLIP